MVNKYLIFLLLLCCCSCKPTRDEINATVWLNNTNATEFKKLCAQERDLWKIGFYRILNSGQIEFISFCNENAYMYFAIESKDFNEILDKYLPKKDE